MAQQPNHKNILQLATKGGIVAILTYIIVFFGGQYLSKITEMQKDLLQIRLELTKIQSTLLSKDDIQNMIVNDVEKHEYKYHGLVNGGK